MPKRENDQLYGKHEVEHKPTTEDFEEEVRRVLDKMKYRDIMHEDAEFFYLTKEGDWVFTGRLSSEGEFDPVGYSRSRGATRYLLDDTKWRIVYNVSKARIEYGKSSPLEPVVEKIKGMPYRLELFVYNKKQDLYLYRERLRRHPKRRKLAELKSSFRTGLKKRIPRRGSKFRRLEAFYQRTLRRVIPTRTTLRLSNIFAFKRVIPSREKVRVRMFKLFKKRGS